METALFIYSVLASMVGGAALTAIAFYRIRLSAPKRFHDRMRQLLEKSVEEGQNNAIKNAKVIIAVRDSLRGSLSSLKELLNSEIDKLGFMIAKESGRYERDFGPFSIAVEKPDPKEVYDQIKVLKDYWINKELIIVNSIKKVLVDLGLL